MFDDLDVADRVQRLDAPIEIALHQVGAADVHLFVAAVVEPEDSRMLQEAADDGSHTDVVADARDAGAQAADAANDQVDPYAGLRGAIEHANHLVIGDRVYLENYLRRTPGFGVLRLAVDQLA